MSYKYVSIKEFGSPEVLDMVTKEDLPEPEEVEVRVKVVAPHSTQIKPIQNCQLSIIN